MAIQPSKSYNQNDFGLDNYTNFMLNYTNSYFLSEIVITCLTLLHFKS